MSGQIFKVILQAETVLNCFLAFNVSTFHIFSLQSKRLTDVYVCQHDIADFSDTAQFTYFIFTFIGAKRGG